MTAQFKSRSRQSGLSYVEVLIAVIVIAATVVPAANSIHGAMNGATADTEATSHHYRVRGRLEELLAEPFSNLSAQAAGVATPSSYSDTAGTPARRLVYISPYDGDNADGDNDPFTDTDADLLWLRVEIEGTVSALQALKTR